MPLIIGIHKIAGSTEEQMQAGWAKYKEAAVGRGLKPIRVKYNLQKGLAFCETEAPTEAAVREAHQDAGVLPDDVIEAKVLE